MNINIIKAFSLTIILIGLLTTFFLSEYISVILMGSIYNLKNPSYPIRSLDADPFQANKTDAQPLTYGNITLMKRIYNASGFEYGLNNFTIDYGLGTVRVT